MLIVDSSDKYILKVDKDRKIVYEKPMGYWKPEDFYRFNNDYEKHVLSVIKNGPWAKCCDLREYKTSMITEEIKKHTTWLTITGFHVGAMILDESATYKSVVEKQMKISTRNLPITLKSFNTLSEANEWLKEMGF